MKTKEEIEAMTDEELRIKTAEICGGWKVVTHVDLPHGRYVGYFPALKLVTEIDFLPDCLNSLDAMHEALQMLKTARQREVFVICLESVETPLWCFDPKAYIGYVEHPADSIFDVFIDRSARDLNKAFLMTML